MTTPETFTVRILTQDGTPVGIGTLVSDNHVLTCAHVVNTALGLGTYDQPKPDGTVTVDFPLLGKAPRTQARVTLWLPPPRQGAAGDDIAGLEITGTALPETAQPVRLAVDAARPGTQVRVFGVPKGRPDGIWAEAIVQGRVLGNRMQLESRSAERIAQGFSGSPVFDEIIGQVTGLVALAPAKATERDCYAITSERLRQAWPPVLGDPQRPQDELIILHLQGPHFPSTVERADLIVVTGDLAEHALPSEYQQAIESLTALAAAAGVPRRHVAIVPGAHDVNRKACQAYFTEQESREAEPVKPYFPKWDQFAAAFRTFYDDETTTFAPDEPWTLFTMPDLGVVVAGLNSTMAMTHEEEDDHGELDEAQLGWFATRLNDHSQLTIAAVYHDGMTLPGADLNLHAIAPGGHELTTVRRPQSEPQPPSPPERDDFFTTVTEATRIRYPAATVTERPRAGYLRVTWPRPDGIAEQWPVGVVSGPATEQAIRDFAGGVHAQFASRDRQVPSELVHEGHAAGPDLTRLARQHGIRLRSLVEYQGMLDLRPLAQAQRERLATDRMYAEQLYIPQRFQLVPNGTIRHGLVEHAVDWLAADSAQLLVVLGDFGRGKTAFLRQLTRTISAELPGLLPILVELRRLEKAPTLEALLVSHLASQDVQNIDTAKLRYMMRSGRLALLFDGFDELELRVGYDNADDYLRTLLASVTEQAKVVLTSRTQHFRSTRQVLTALGERVATLAGSRVIVLEDLSDEQITEFMIKLYDGNRARARERLDLIGGIGNLRDLAHNPRMLTFLAALDDHRLRAVRSRAGEITAADLYHEIIYSWLEWETERQTYHRGLQPLSWQERFDACSALALRMWATGSSTIRLVDLSTEVSTTLTGLAERGFSEEQVSHAIASGSLLVRTEEGNFAFVHRSVMEWLVASAVAEDPLLTPFLTSQRMSRLMARFYVDVAGDAAARQWADLMLASDDSSEIAKQNAMTIVDETGERRGSLSPPVSRPGPPILAGVDLRDQDLDGRDLAGANLRGANLRDMRLNGTNLRAADLSDADLRGARLDGCFLADAMLTGSKWDRAAVLGSDLAGSRPELAVAAMPGRDPADVMIEPSLSPSYVAYSPDGTLLAIASGDHVEILDTTDYRILRILRGTRGRLIRITFSPDGTRLAAAARRGPQVWEVASGTMIRGVDADDHHHAVLDVAFFPDSAMLATAFDDGITRVRVLDADGPHDALDSYSAIGSTLAFSADGTIVAIGTRGTVRVSRIDDETVRHQIRMPRRRASALAFSPDNSLLACAASDGTVLVWDLAANAERATLPGNGHRMGSPTFSPDGTLLATASASGSLTVWDVAAGGPAHELRFSDGLHGTAFSPDGAELALAGSRQVYVVDMGTWALRTVRDSAPQSARVTFEADGSRLTATFASRPTRIWDLIRGTAAPGQLRMPDPAGVTAYSPDGLRLAQAQEGIVLTGPPNGPLTILDGDWSQVSCLEFSTDSRFLAVCSTDGFTQLWDVVRKVPGEYLASTEDVFETPTSAAFMPGQNRLAIGYASGRVILWDLARLSKVTTWTFRVAHHVGAKVRELPQLATVMGHGDAVHGLAFTRDGSMLASASADGTTTLWAGDLGRRLATVRGHVGPVRAVTFSPNARRLATAGEDHTIRIWDLTDTSEPISEMALLDLPDDGYATLLPDGRYKLKGDPPTTLWWAVKLCRFAPGELDASVPGLTRLAEDTPL